MGSSQDAGQDLALPTLVSGETDVLPVSVWYLPPSSETRGLKELPI